MRFFCRENDLRTSSGKFLRVESCHPESSDFLGLWPFHYSHPESQKPRQRVSNADRKVFANPESFCDKFIIG